MATRALPQTAARRQASTEVGAFLRHVDYLLLAAVGGVVAYGLWVLAAVTRNDIAGEPSYFVVRQEIYVAAGAVVLALLAAVNPEVLRRYGRVLYGVAIVLLLLVFPLAENVRGSKRWITFGSFNFQPSELGKLFLILFLAGFVAERARRASEWRVTWAVVGLAAVPIVLVFQEPDFGSALLYGCAAAAVLVFAGVPWKQLATLLAALVAMAVSILWLLPSAGVEVLDKYQKDRLVGFLHPDVDPGGTTYNVNQSITAVGSGGYDGRGIAGATQTKLDFLPEHSTDFIFSSLAEQRGFIGAAILLLLYALIAWRGIKIIAVASTLFSATVAGAIVFAFLVQVFINVGMTIGIAPVTGIPLPFVSYGGSSMITTLAMIGLLEAIHVRGKLAGQR
jgi:rod shape determining protein RodA